MKGRTRNAETGEHDFLYAEADIGFDVDEPTRIAREAFGVQFLFPWQRLVIGNILDAADSAAKNPLFTQQLDDDVRCRGRQVVLLPTGAGKSLCFLVPALMLPGPTLVLYPLLALMKDQMRRMEAAGIPCVAFRGGQTDGERERNFERIASGAKVILANPEVLQSEKLVSRLSACGISHVAIDEAHCAAEWGDSFRPAYLALGSLVKRLGAPVVTAFTATASPPVLSRLGDIIFDGHYHLLQGESDRANIRYEVRYAYAKEKAALSCAKELRRPMIVFCGTRRRAEEMARILAAHFGSGAAKFYHAGMTAEEKANVEQWFFDSDDGILAATCAYGMGMDKGNVRSVVHLDAPEHLENFCQEAGRAGRNGERAQSVLIWSRADTARHRKLPVGSRERAMGVFALSRTCRRQIMLDYLGGEQAVCAGCDVCDAERRGESLPQTAEDAEFALSFIRRHRRLFTYDEAVGELTARFNERSRETFGEHVWESSDTEEILSALLAERRIRRCGGFWKNLLDIERIGVRSALRVIPKRRLRRLQRFRLLLRRARRLPASPFAS